MTKRYIICDTHDQFCHLVGREQTGEDAGTWQLNDCIHVTEIEQLRGIGDAIFVQYGPCDLHQTRELLILARQIHLNSTYLTDYSVIKS